MSTQVTNYQCPACTGPLHFVGQSGQLECDYCGSKYPVAEIEALYAQKEAEAAENFAEAEAQGEEKAWDMSGMSGDWGAEGEGMKAYNCPSCGAELICDATTAATACPYCGNPSIVPGQFGGSLKPDLIIPFKLDKEEAKAALQKHYKGKFFLPKAFKEQNHLEELKGLYVPFWLYDARVRADCHFQATRSHTYTSGDYEITETDHYAVRRAGTVDFEKVPADGSTKMNDEYMDSLEPYDYSELCPFSTAYLPGFLADRYDVSAEENIKRVDERFRRSALSIMEGDVHGYHSVLPAGNATDIYPGPVRYALLPVWTLLTKWKGENYLFMMNGQTGKFVGDLPVDRKKYWSLFGGIFAAMILLLILTGVAGLF